MQRIAILTHALGQTHPDPNLIYSGMQDAIHQPYRKSLIPGLAEILQSVKPATHPGLLGICLSGAGPTILALATENFDHIAQEIIKRFNEANVQCQWRLLEPARWCDCYQMKSARLPKCSQRSRTMNELPPLLSEHPLDTTTMR